MLSARLSLRTSMVTLAANPERKTAAWPAEFPPPTSATCSCRHVRASIGEAQYQTPRPSNSCRRGTIGSSALDQGDAAQDERPHDPLAELGLGNQQGAQAVGRNEQRHVRSAEPSLQLTISDTCGRT